MFVIVTHAMEVFIMQNNSYVASCVHKSGASLSVSSLAS